MSLSATIAPAASAHEGHQDDMSDAEMVQMEMQQAEGMDSHADAHADDDHHDGAMQDHHETATAIEEQSAAAVLTP